MNLKEAATRASGKIVNETYQFNPAIILLIIEGINMILPLLQEYCNKEPEEAVAIAKNPSWLEYRVARFQVRRALGRRAYRECGKEVLTAMLETGGELTTDEMSDLYEEAANNADDES